MVIIHTAGISKTQTETTLDLMQKSDFQFYETGSQVFRDKIPSDLDFFTERNAEIEKWLCKNGFYYLEKRYVEDRGECYILDSNLLGVYRKEHYEQGGKQIDVQIVLDASKKEHAQNMILRNSDWRKIYNVLSKKDRTFFWNAVMTSLKL